MVVALGVMLLQTAMQCLAKAQEVVYLSSWGGASRDTPELVKILSELTEAARVAAGAVESAIERKDEAGRIRAEVLGQLDSQQERLNQVKGVRLKLVMDLSR
jgi:hypothetical protein